MTPPAGLLAPESTALLVIDLQEKLLPAIWEKDRLLANVQKLLRLAGLLKMKILTTTQYARGLGATVEQVACLAPEPPLDKTLSEVEVAATDPEGSSSFRAPGRSWSVPHVPESPLGCRRG